MSMTSLTVVLFFDVLVILGVLGVYNDSDIQYNSNFLYIRDVKDSSENPNTVTGKSLISAKAALDGIDDRWQLCPQ